MLNNIILALVVIGIPAAIVFILPKSVQKGINVAKALATAEGALNTTDAIVKVADKLMPTNPAIDILQIILTLAKKGVGGAEQLYKTSQLPADQRNAKAKETVNSALKVLEVPVTDNIQTVINGAIEAEVLLLPKIVLTDAEKQQAMIQLQAANAQLTAEKLKLTQTIAQFKSVAATV